MRQQPASAQDDAPRPNVALLEEPFRVRPRYRLRVAVPSLGEIPYPLVASPANDRDLTTGVQHLQHEADLPLTPPAMRGPPARPVIRDLPGEQRAALLELPKHVALKVPILRQVPCPPALPRARIRRPAHAREQCGQVLSRPQEGVPLDQRPLVPEQAVELTTVIAQAEPAPQHEVLRRRNGGDRIQLEESEMADRAQDVGRRAVQQLGVDCDTAALFGTHLDQAVSLQAGSGSPSRSSASRSRSPPTKAMCPSSSRGHCSIGRSHISSSPLPSGSLR